MLVPEARPAHPSFYPLAPRRAARGRCPGSQRPSASPLKASAGQAVREPAFRERP